MGDVKILDERLEGQRASKEAAFRATKLSAEQKRVVGQHTAARARAVFENEGEPHPTHKYVTKEKGWLIFSSYVVSPDGIYNGKRAVRVYTKGEESCQVTLVQSDDDTFEIAIGDVDVEAHPYFTFRDGARSGLTGSGGGSGNVIGVMFDPAYGDAQDLDELLSLFDGQTHNYTSLVTVETVGAQ